MRNKSVWERACGLTRTVVEDGASARAADTDVAAIVDSVSLNNGSLVLNLQGIGPVPFGSVREII